MRLLKTVVSVMLALSMLFSVCYADFISAAPTITSSSELIEIEWAEANEINSYLPDNVSFNIKISMKGKKPTDYGVYAVIDGKIEQSIARLTALPYEELSKNLKINNLDCGKRAIKLMVKKNGEIVFEKDYSIAVLEPYTKQFMDEIAEPAMNMNHCDNTDLLYVQKMGFKEFRRSYYWRKAEKIKGNYVRDEDGPKSDKVLEGGMRLIATGGYGHQTLYPMWEEQVGKALPTTVLDTAGPHVQEGIMGYVDFVKYGVFDVAPEVKIFEVWNEPNLGSFKPAETREHNYLNLLKATGAGVRNELKNKRIGGFVYAVEGQNELLDRYFEAGAYPYFDVMTYHFYNTTINIDDSHFYEEKMKTVAGFPLKYGGWKKVYLTEMGWPNGTSSVGVPERVSALNMPKLYTIGDAVGQQVAMFTANNGGEDLNYSEENFGMYKSEAQGRELKEQYYSIATRNTQLNGGVFVGEADLGDEEIRAFVYLKENKPVMQIWDGSKERDSVDYTFEGEKVNVVGMNGDVISNETDTVTLTVEPTYINGLSEKYVYNAAKADLKRDKAEYLETYKEMLAGELLKKAEETYDDAISVCDNPTEQTAKGAIDKFNQLGKDIIKAFSDGKLDDITASRASFELSGSLETLAVLYMSVYEGDALNGLKYTTAAAQTKADKLYRDDNRILKYSDSILAYAVDVEEKANTILSAGYSSEDIKAYIAGWGELIRVYCDWFDIFSNSEAITYYSLMAQVLPSSTSGYINDTIPIKINLNNVSKIPFKGRVAIFDEAGNEIATTGSMELKASGHEYAELPIKLTEDRARLHICYINANGEKLTDDLLRIEIKDRISVFVVPSDETLDNMKALKIRLTNMTDEPQTMNVELETDENMSLLSNNESVTLSANEERVVEFPIASINETRFHYYTFKYKVKGESGELLASGETPVNFTAMVKAEQPIDVKSFGGDVSDWEDAYPIYINAPSKPNDPEAWKTADASARVFMKYDDKNVYFMADVYDDRQWNIFTGQSLWNGDCIQISFDQLNTKSAKYDADDIELGIAKGASGDELSCWQGKMTTGILDYVKVIRNDELCVTRYLAAFPLSDLTNIKPDDGYTFGFNVAVNDGDALARDDFFEFTGGTAGSKNPSLYMDFTFRDKSGGTFIESQGDIIFTDKVESKIMK